MAGVGSGCRKLFSNPRQGGGQGLQGSLQVAGPAVSDPAAAAAETFNGLQRGGSVHQPQRQLVVVELVRAAACVENPTFATLFLVSYQYNDNVLQFYYQQVIILSVQDPEFCKFTAKSYLYPTYLFFYLLSCHAMVENSHFDGQSVSEHPVPSHSCHQHFSIINCDILDSMRGFVVFINATNSKAKGD